MQNVHISVVLTLFDQTLQTTRVNLMDHCV